MKRFFFSGLAGFFPQFLHLLRLFAALVVIFFFAVPGCWVSGSIHDAARNGKKEVVQRWLSVMGDVNEKDSRGATPLHCAVEGGHREIVQMLLDKGADLQAKNDFGNTPLHEASYRGDIELVKFLVSKGADLKAKAVDGKTPLELAEKYSQKGTADFLRSLGQK